MNYQIALSYASEDSWIAKDIYEMLSHYAMSVYCYDRMPDVTGGMLRAHLDQIYSKSWINILIHPTRKLCVLRAPKIAASP
jgi:hypothetical protein